ncbi:MAG: hypothetical protein ACRD8O_01680 [Bryobacteraceae bacterium]
MIDPYERHRQAEAAREAALADVARLLSEDRIDEAERAIQLVNADLSFHVNIAKLYQRRLEQLVSSGLTAQTKPRAEAIFKQALMWAQTAYPEPQTEVEMSNYDSGRREDRARLVRILGYEPTLD